MKTLFLFILNFILNIFKVTKQIIYKDGNPVMYLTNASTVSLSTDVNQAVTYNTTAEASNDLNIVKTKVPPTDYSKFHIGPIPKPH